MSAEQAQQRLTAETTVGNLADYFTVLGGIDSNHRLHFDRDGITVATKDPANVAAVDTFVPAQSFDSYDTAGEPAEIGIDADAALAAIVGDDDRISKHDTVRLTVDDEEFECTVVGARTGDHKRTVTFGTLPADSLREAPDTDTFGDREWRVEIDSRDFVNAVRAFDQFTIHPHVEVSSDGLRLNGAAGDGPNSAVEKGLSLAVEGDTEPIGDGVSSPNASSFFSVDYLVQFADAIGALGYSTDVALEFGDAVPMKIAFDPPGEEWAAEYAYYVAPRLTSGGDGE